MSDVDCNPLEAADGNPVASDPYPSRGNGRARLIERHDPIPWCAVDAPADGPLDEAALRSFADNGYLIVDSLFSEKEVRALRDALERFTSLHVVA